MYGIPKTSFPGLNEPGSGAESEPRRDLDSELSSLLINSDSSECNENLSIYIKFIIDNVYNNAVIDNQRTYHSVSLYALKLLTSNMFVKNYRFCIGKILAFLNTFSMVPPDEYPPSADSDDDNLQLVYEKECLKEFLCIILLLLLKMENEDCNDKAMDIAAVFETLRDYDFITVISNFITCNVINIHYPSSTPDSSSPYILLKFSCDVLFEYLYHTELLSDVEFDDLTNKTKLIPTLIKHLLSNDSFNQYDLDGDNSEDEDRLIAYEQFKLLLFINEQYLMKSYSCSVKNKVFEGLMGSRVSKRASTQDATKITGFINLMIYHLNREDSRIIKILILKFLYMIFTTSYTSRLIYMNDLRILIEIFIRDMNDLDYTEEIENVILILTYLKVLYPLLRFSQLNEDGNGFKRRELNELLGNIIINSEVDQDNQSVSENQRDQRKTISKMATKCMSIDWLQKQQPPPRKDSSASNSADESFTESPHNDSTTSFESLDVSLTRVASVRTSTRRDFYHHTSTTSGRKVSKSQFTENNNNVFMSNEFKLLTIDQETSQQSPWGTETNMLDLSSDYLSSKPLPKVPVPSKQQNQFYRNNDSSTSSVNSSSSLVRKALKKKAPPPPPSHHNHQTTKVNTPPPPPPPRRRRN